MTAPGTVPGAAAPVEGGSTRTFTEEDVRDLRAAVAPGSPEAAELEARLQGACVVPRAHLPADVVNLKAVVEVEAEATRRHQLVQVVLPSQADAARGWISAFTRVGAELLGRRLGQALEWAPPRGAPLKVRIVRVLQQAPHVPPRLG